VSSNPRLSEQVVQREGFPALHKIALIDVDGAIQNARGAQLLGGSTDNPVVAFKEKLDAARRDVGVKAVVLRINSPGGGVTATDMMYEELRAFREKSKKPVVTSMLDLAASGGYYLACGTQHIVAMPTTVTGSIGVIMLTPDLSGGMSKLGIRMNVIKSGQLKDAGSPFRAQTEADRAVFEGMVTKMYERFLSVVGEGRPQLPAERIRALADGRVYLGEEALAAGLVDELGTVQTAIDKARALAGIAGENYVVVQYARSHGYKANVYAQPAAPQVNLVNFNLPSSLLSTPEFMYLWMP
jgi:protease-4